MDVMVTDGGSSSYNNSAGCNTKPGNRYPPPRPPYNRNFSRSDPSHDQRLTGELQWRLCKYWMVNAECPYGARCKFLHSWYRASGTGHGCFSMLARLDGHKKAICGIALATATGSNKLYTGSRDGTVRIWDCHSGKCDRVINLGAEIWCFKREGPWIFIGLPNLVRVWNLSDNNEFSLNGPVGQVYALAVYRDLLFAGASNGAILVWKWSFDANPFKLVATIEAHKQAVVCLHVDGAANGLYSGSMDGTLKVWDFETLQCKQTLKCHGNAVMSLFSWEKLLLSCSLDHTMKVWTVKEGGCLELVHTHEEKYGIVKVFGMQDAEGKPVLCCSCVDNCVRLYELDSFTEKGRIFGKQEIREIQMGPGGLFFTGDATGMVTVWMWHPDTSMEVS